MSSQIFLQNLRSGTTQVSIIIPIANNRTAANFVYRYLMNAPSFMEFILVYDEEDLSFLATVRRELKNFRNVRLVAIQCNVRSPGLARNIGFKHALGEWVAFWDCDDKINLERFISEFNDLSNSEADIVIWNFQKCIDIAGSKDSSVILHGSSIINVATNPGIWRMLFRRNVISGIKFTNLLWGEDLLYFCSLLGLEPTVTFRNEIFYEYTIGNPEQLTAQRVRAAHLDTAAQEVSRVLKEFEVANDELRQSLKIILMGIHMTQLKYSSLAALPGRVYCILRGSTNFGLLDRIKTFLMIIIVRKRQNIKTSNESLIVSLTGGLGNQLFQYAAGVYFSLKLNKKLYFEKEIGKPRVNELGVPSLFSLVDESQYPTFTFKRFRKVFRKLTNLMLRVSLNSEKTPVDKAIQVMTRLSILGFSHNFIPGIKDFRFIIPNELGFYEIVSWKRNLFIRGYFQTFKYLENKVLFEKIMDFKPNSFSLELMRLSKEMMSKRVLIVHVRLGDYLKLDEFGIPSVNYYLNAIREVLELSKIDEIWMFSDQPDLAGKMFESTDMTKIRIIENFSKDDSQILELMRYGSAYVIGNSSFAWWAAKLSYNADAIVMVPSPWFKKIKEPSFLIPPNWLRRDANFSK